MEGKPAGIECVEDAGSSYAQQHLRPKALYVLVGPRSALSHRSRGSWPPLRHSPPRWQHLQPIQLPPPRSVRKGAPKIRGRQTRCPAVTSVPRPEKHRNV